MRKSVTNDCLTFEETKIDKVIKNYLVEREEILFNGDGVNCEFTQNSVKSFLEISKKIGKNIETLNKIKNDECGVFYSDEFIDNLVSDLESVVVGLDFLKGL